MLRVSAILVELGSLLLTAMEPLWCVIVSSMALRFSTLLTDDVLYMPRQIMPHFDFATI